MFDRMKRLLAFPFYATIARLWPVRYARMIGVNLEGRVTIYGSSYEMFSTEPFLVTLHDNVYVSVGAKFICHDGGVLPFRAEHPTLDLAAPITVHKNCFIGMGAVILKGVTVGANSIVGAYSVVTKDVPEGHIVAGNPARIIKTTISYINDSLEQSLDIGHLKEADKDREYRRIFRKK